MAGCAADTIQDLELGGLRLARLTRAGLVEHVFAALARGEGGWVVTANVDHLRLLQSKPSLPSKSNCTHPP